MSATAGPIRVGFIGLSEKSWAAGSHAPYLLSSDKYKIVALANSSVDSAKAAIKAFNLPETTKAYGSPDELANDPDVQLFVVSVRVDKHFDATVPILKAGKDVLVEWPLGKDLAEAEELLRLSKAGGVKSTYVNLQGSHAPATIKINELITQGRIGKVLSSTFVGQIGFNIDVMDIPASSLYDAKVGGNVTTVFVGHVSEAMQHAFGEPLVLSSSLLTNRIPDVSIVQNDGTLKPYKKDTHDHAMILAQTATTGVPISIVLRPGASLKGTPGLDWRISGTTGEIRITAPTARLNGFEDANITVWEFGKDEALEVAIPTDEQDKLIPWAQNIGRQYEAIKVGNAKHLVTFEQAVERHRFIDALLKANIL